MRISNWMMQHNALRDLRGNLAALNAAQQQAASGRRVRTLSDDPVSASHLMRIESQLNDIDQFRRNGTVATTRLAAEDVVLTTVQDLLKRAKELAISAATQSPGDPLRQTAIQEVDRIREQIISLGNTRVGNEYIFGGGVIAAAPFRPDGTYAGDTTVRQAAIEEGTILATNHTGDQMLLGALTALSDMSTQLQTGTQLQVEATVASVDAAQAQALSAQAEIGSRMREVRTAGDHLARRTSTLLDRVESLRDADPAESLLRVSAAQSALERAYAVIGKIFSVSLTDYLR